MNDKVSQISKTVINNPIWLPSCHSTNEYAKNWVQKNHVTDGWTVSTYEQTRGKGQRGNTWESEPYKNLTFSTVYFPVSFDISKLFYLDICFALAVADFLFSKQVSCSIKWPNDIYIGSKKVAGILVEPQIRNKSVSHFIAGVGLNVNQKIFSIPSATSLSVILGKELKLEDLLLELLGYITVRMELLKNHQFEILSYDYHKKLYLKDIVAPFRTDVSSFMGIIKGVNEIGHLLIETEEGNRSFDIKEVQFLK